MDLVSLKRVLVATSNEGKLRDFEGAALPYGITIAGVPDFAALPPVVEDGATFEANARKKAEAYSLAVPGEMVLADDSGLEVDVLAGAPGVHSARYAHLGDRPEVATKDGSHVYATHANAEDTANNAKLLRELAHVPDDKRGARFVCALAVARDGVTLAVFRGEVEGIILREPRGHHGFGYDSLFVLAGSHNPAPGLALLGETFAEMSAEEKAQHSHRGAAFRLFLDWAAR